MTTIDHPPTTTEPTATPNQVPAPATGDQPGTTMEAITQYRYGSADVLGLSTIERPTPEADEVLIEVEAAGVDRGTCHLVSGTPYLIRLAGFGLLRPKQPVPGFDVAGRVVAIGADVTRFAVGDEVFGIARGSLAPYTVAEQDKLVAKPAHLGFEHAAASSISGGTALQALTDVGRVQPGQRVLIIGASGGVGSFAVQLAKALGATVTGVASTRNQELVRSLGADHAIDYTTTDVTKGDERYDLILDIGGRTAVSRLRRVLHSAGTLVIVGGEGGNRITGGIGRQLLALALSPFVSQRLTTFIASESHTLLERLTSFLDDGSVVPSIQARYPLDQAPTAIARLEAGHGSGKSVIVIGSDQNPTTGPSQASTDTNQGDLR